MKIMILSVLIFIGLISNVLAADHLVISQALYDPVTTETGGEAIELYNPTMKDISLVGYVIKTKTSATDVILPNATIKSKGFYLIGDAGWSINKDNVNYSNADYEDTFTLVNTDGGLALTFNGTVIDSLGWGNSSNLASDLFEGSTANGMKEGYSLKRLNLDIDTNNNSLDFIESIPDLKNSSFVNTQEYNQGEINLTITINNSAPVIGAVNVEDDLEEQGIQIIPNLDSNREIKFNISFNDPDGIEDFNRMEVRFNGNKISFNKTQGVVALESVDEAGNYSLDITVYDKANVSVNTTVKIEYKELSAVSLDVRKLSFDATGKDNLTIVGDKDLTTGDKPTIKNIGNTKLNLGAISSGTESLPFSNIEFSINGVKKILNTDLNLVSTSLKPGQLTDLSLYLSSSQGLRSGTYSGKIIIVGVPA